MSSATRSAAKGAADKNHGSPADSDKQLGPNYFQLGHILEDHGSRYVSLTLRWKADDGNGVASYCSVNNVLWYAPTAAAGASTSPAQAPTPPCSTSTAKAATAPAPGATIHSRPLIHPDSARVAAHTGTRVRRRRSTKT